MTDIGTKKAIKEAIKKIEKLSKTDKKEAKKLREESAEIMNDIGK